MMWKFIVAFMLVASVAQAQSTTASFPGGSHEGAFVTDPGCAANEIPARNAGNTAWVCTTNTAGGAPANAGYWTSAPDGGLSSEKDLSGFIGLVLNTSGNPSSYAGATCAAGSGHVRTLAANGAATCNATDLSSADVSNTLPVTRGGRGITAVTDDSIDVANGTGFDLKPIPDCDDSLGQHLNYDTTTNGFTCGTSTPTALGTGDVTSNTTTSFDSELPLYSGTGGKTLKRSAGLTGVVELTSGVVEVVSSTGTGIFVRKDQPLLNDPAILLWNNANHTHASGPQGGQLNPANVFTTTIPVSVGGTGTTTSTGSGSIVLNGGSPTFTGTPLAPTAAPTTNTTQLATTAFVEERSVRTGAVTGIQLEDILGGALNCTNCQLTLDANGRVTGYATGSTVVPGGSDTMVQYNDGGTLAGNAGLIFNKTTHAVTATGPVTSTTNSTAGGYLELGEDTDLGTSTWRIDLAATNLGGNFSITPGTDGKLSGASLLTAASTTPTELSTAAKEYVMCSSNVTITTSAISIDLGMIPVASTIVKAWCITRGTITTAPQFNIDECATDGSSCDPMTTSALSCGNTTASTTTFGGTEGTSAAVDAVIQATTANTPSVVAGQLTVCAAFTPN